MYFIDELKLKFNEVSTQPSKLFERVAGIDGISATYQMPGGLTPEQFACTHFWIPNEDYTVWHPPPALRGVCAKTDIYPFSKFGKIPLPYGQSLVAAWESLVELNPDLQGVVFGNKRFKNKKKWGCPK